jgi:hypothetical protein
MIKLLFAISAVFVSYVVYALVGEQIEINAQASQEKPARPVVTVKPSRTRAVRKSAKAKKAKPLATVAVEKGAPEPIVLAANAIRGYLVNNGATTVAKLARELPEGKKTIQLGIERLVQEGAITHKTVGRAKVVALTA